MSDIGIKELKLIKDKLVYINNLKNDIKLKFNDCKDDKFIYVFYNIIEDINENMRINKVSLLAIYDFVEPCGSESKEYIINHMDFIMDLHLIDNINLNDYENTFSEFIRKLNENIINQLVFIQNNIDLTNMYNIYSIIDRLYNSELDYNNYINDLNSIIVFYESYIKIFDRFLDKYNN